MPYELPDSQAYDFGLPQHLEGPIGSYVGHIFRNTTLEPAVAAAVVAAYVAGGGVIGAPAGSLIVQDEGGALATAAGVMNFVGAGVTASGTGATKTITITGSPALTVKENGTIVSAVIAVLDFLGADFDLTESPSGEANIALSNTVARLSGGLVPIANLATGTPDGTKFVRDDGTLAVPAGGGGSAITVSDEGTPLATAATTLNFVGAGVTATGTGADKTITIPGAGSATITVKENTTTLSSVVTALDFLGADFDLTESPSGEVNIVINASISRTGHAHTFGDVSGTIVAPTTSGLQTSSGALVTTANVMGANAIDTSRWLNRKSVSADATLTFNVQPASADHWFVCELTNTDSATHRFTLPSCVSAETGTTAAHVLIVGAGATVLATFKWNGTAYIWYGPFGYLNNWAATTDPGVGDDLADGYGPGSHWLNVTGNTVWVCESNGAGAAVWHNLSASGGSVALADVTDMSANARTFNAAANYAAMRTAIGLVIGTDVQAFSANLAEYAAVNPSAAGLAILDDADAAAQRTTLGLVIGTNVQAFSANLDEYAAVNPSAAGLALLDDADAAAQRTTLSAAARAQSSQFTFYIPTVADGDVMVVPIDAFGGSVTKITTDCISGTCTLTGKINSTALGGTANSVSSTKTSQTHASANAFVATDDLVFTASSNAACLGMRVTVTYSRTLA